MRDREIFAALAALPPLFVRLDGRAFHRLARALDLARPFDERFAAAMAAVAHRLVTDSGTAPVLAYTFSDEISCLFARLPFGGRVEKLDSVLAAFAASALTIELDLAEPVAFDARVVFVDRPAALAYLVERQAEAWRNHVNACAQALLVRDGLSPREAAARLRGMASPALHDLAFAHGVNLGETPAWQRRGVLVYRRPVEVQGRDPRTGAVATAVRSRAYVDRDLPLFHSEEGRALFARLLPESPGTA